MKPGVDVKYELIMSYHAKQISLTPVELPARNADESQAIMVTRHKEVPAKEVNVDGADGGARAAMKTVLPERNADKKLGMVNDAGPAVSSRPESRMWLARRKPPQQGNL